MVLLALATVQVIPAQLVIAPTGGRRRTGRHDLSAPDAFKDGHGASVASSHKRPLQRHFDLGSRKPTQIGAAPAKVCEGFWETGAGPPVPLGHSPTNCRCRGRFSNAMETQSDQA